MVAFRTVVSTNHPSKKSSLSVFEGDSLPLTVVRTFLVTASSGEIRGDHAHKVCSQMMIAVSGKIQVSVFDGSTSREFLLVNPGQGLLVPPLHWSTQRYLVDDSVLLVLCDQVYSEDDYIRSFEVFKNVTRGS